MEQDRDPKKSDPVLGKLGINVAPIAVLAKM
jgi:hypothetical protein